MPFPLNPKVLVGKHLLKTCAMNIFIRENGLEALATAIRRDEQSARGQENYFSDRPDNDPPHTRVHPILHFTERDVWDAILENKIPYCGLYAQGYRSLGARYNTFKTSDLPAWEQDLDSVAGARRQGSGERTTHGQASGARLHVRCYSGSSPRCRAGCRNNGGVPAVTANLLKVAVCPQAGPLKEALCRPPRAAPQVRRPHLR